MTTTDNTLREQIRNIIEAVENLATDLPDDTKPMMTADNAVEAVASQIQLAEISASASTLSALFHDGHIDEEFYDSEIDALQAQKAVLEGQDEKPHVHDNFCLNYGKCSE